MTTREKLAGAIATAQGLLAKRQELTQASQQASDAANAVRAELAELEARADTLARQSVEGGDASALDDVETKLAACRRRLAAAEAVAQERMAKASAGNTAIQAAQDAARWAARDVLAAESEAMLKRFVAVQREALALRWKLDGLRAHLWEARKGSRHNGPSFDLPPTLGERLRDAIYVDERENWNGKTFEAEWRKAEEALMLDPDAELG